MVKLNRFRGRRLSVAFAVLGVVATAGVIAITASAAGAAAAAKPAAAKSAAASKVVITLRGHGSTLPSGVVPSLAFVACQGNSPYIPTGPCPLAPPKDEGDTPAAPSFIPHAKAARLGVPAGPKVKSDFLGQTDVSQAADSGSLDTPPDQGLCVGPAGPLEGAGMNLGVPSDASVVVEQVNDGVAVFDTAGNTLYHNSDANLFDDANSTGDPECNYDPATETYFFTEIGAANGMYYSTNISVLNLNGWAAYSLDSSNGGGYCFPDFPHQGYDSNALYLTVNEFCGSNEDYAGSSIFAIDKTGLVNEGSPYATEWSLGSTYFTFRPASGPSGTEYLLASEQNYSEGDYLDIAWVTGDNKLASGGLPVLSLTSIPSEPYAEPVPALSTGDDTSCVYVNHSDPGQPDDQTWCSVPEASLDPIDMRLEQVQLSHGLLYTSLLTAVTVGADPTVVDGAAWFVVDPKKLKVTKQGYVGATKTWMVNPSFLQSKWDKKGKTSHFVMSFGMTSTTMNPSTGFMSSTNAGNTFSEIQAVGVGAGPHVSFADNYPDYYRRRWGDYSAMAIDPATGYVWSAHEYIPSGPDGQNGVDNWGTRVWAVSK